MLIEVNGEKKELANPRSLAEAIEILGYEGARIAVACNEEFVPRSRYASLQLQNGDRLEIVSPMQGG
ncbi:MAG TPA: sulfur carrier protein ThiS [Candidatus Competibacter sp.]|nr:sulfur carrier protein ThiS [Candidatus Competibacter sp.]